MTLTIAIAAYAAAMVLANLSVAAFGIGTGYNNGVKSENEAGERNNDGPANQQTVFHKQIINKKDNEKLNQLKPKCAAGVVFWHNRCYR